MFAARPPTKRRDQRSHEGAVSATLQGCRQRRHRAERRSERQLRQSVPLERQH